MVKFDSFPNTLKSSFLNLEIQADGKILAGGFRNVHLNNQWTYNMSISRILADGSLDASFGAGGLAEVGSSHYLFALDFKTDGSHIYAVGTRTEFVPYVSQFFKVDLNGAIVGAANLPSNEGYYLNLELGGPTSLLLGGPLQDGYDFNLLSVDR